MLHHNLCSYCKSTRRNRGCCISVAAAAIVFCLVLYVGINSLQQQQQQVDPVVMEEMEGVMGGDAGREIAEEKLDKQVAKYVVDTSTCKIPEMDPFDRSIKQFLKPSFGYPVDCKGSHKGWTFINGREIIVNKSAVLESGYSVNSIYCCYRIIERVEQPWSDYDMNADNYVKYSDKCHPLLKSATVLDAEFIRVHCISKLHPLYNDVIYRDFFAIAQPSSDRLVFRKLQTWNASSSPPHSSVSQKTPPPNVVLIGIDNNSRMNSYRNLPQTLQVLRSLGAVELLGYTKVGENTHPNTVPFLSGYSVKQIEPICYNSNADPQDDCPYIWKAFDDANYLTVHAEDTPYLGGFNYLRTGFVKKPTDFYLRPLMLAVMTYMPRFDYYHTDCIGRQMTDEFIFNYILDVIRLASAHGAPVFVHNWLTSLAHLNLNDVQFGDHSISSFIQKLVNVSGDNTIFFFMSDHGQRYGPIRETVQGWYEDKLPTQWVYIPQRIRHLYPEWYSNLKINSARLTSHFDVYKTMLQILKVTSTADTKNVLEVAKQQFGLSLFDFIPENRTCDEAGISVNLCACSKPKSVDSEKDPKVFQAATAAVQHLQSLVPLNVCEKPELKKIVSAGYLDLPGRPVYVITLVTDPGDFLFEVNVEVVNGKGGFVVSTDFLRMNKITRKADCVKTPLLERYCYCK